VSIIDYIITGPKRTIPHLLFYVIPFTVTLHISSDIDSITEVERCTRFVCECVLCHVFSLVFIYCRHESVFGS
jgi:hypothetical protein